MPDNLSVSVGMVLNVITILVLMSKRLKESSYTYLTSLAVADFLSLLLFGINSIGRGHFPHVFTWEMFETFVYFPMALITTNASVFMIVSVTIERFVFLYRPMKAKWWCTQCKARRLVTVLWIVSVIMNIPRFFVFKVTADGKLGYTTFGKSTVYTAISWIYFLVFALGCGLILIVFNILLIRGIHATNEKRRQLQCSQSNEQEKSEENRLTRTLISVIFLYLVGELPSNIFSRLVFSAILGEGNQDVMKNLWYEFCLCIATIFVVLQHSLNFVFYCVFNKRFYNILKKRCQFCFRTTYKRNHNDKTKYTCIKEKVLLTAEHNDDLSCIQTDADHK